MAILTPQVKRILRAEVTSETVAFTDDNLRLSVPAYGHGTLQGLLVPALSTDAFENDVNGLVDVKESCCWAKTPATIRILKQTQSHIIFLLLFL